MSRLTNDLDRLSLRGSQRRAEDVIGSAFEAGYAEAPGVRTRSSRVLVGVAAASIVAVAVGASASLIANRQTDEPPVQEPTPTQPPRTETTDNVPEPTATPSTTSTTVPTSFAAEGLADLATLDRDHLIVASAIPIGWTVSPVVLDNGSQRWEFRDRARNASGRVDAFGGLDDAPGSGTAAPEVRWQVESSGEMFLTYQARANNDDQVLVTAFGSDPELFDEFRSELEQFVLGLRVGSRNDHPSGTFDPSTDGAVVSTLDADLVVRAAAVGEHSCWSIVSDTSSTSVDCAINPLDQQFESTTVTSDGIALLSAGGTGIPENYTESDAPIVTSIVTVVGITSLDIETVTMTLSSGEAVSVPTGDLDDELGVRFFAYRTVVDGNAFLGDGLIDSITAPDQ